MLTQSGANSTSGITISQTRVNAKLRCDASVLWSFYGILKLVALGLDLIFFISVMSAGELLFLTPTGLWAITVSASAFLISGLFLICYVTHICEKFHSLPWTLTESIFCGLTSFFFVTASVTLIVKYKAGFKPFWVASLDGFGAVFIYAFDSLMKFMRWQKGKLAQGDRRIEIAQDVVNF